MTKHAKIATIGAMRYASAAALIGLFGHLERLSVPLGGVADPVTIALVRRRGADRVPAWLMPDILERCATHLGDPLFGLRYGQQVDPAIYGPLSLLWKYAPTVRYSNRVTSRILHLQHDGVGVAARKLDDETSGLVYRLDQAPGGANRQFVESGVSFMLRICRFIMGAGWSPSLVTFGHAALAEEARYADVLGAPVAFDAAFDGLIVRTVDLDRRSPEHDAEILSFVEKNLLLIAERDPLPFRARLEQVVDDLISLGAPRLSAAAAAMAMSTRTLQRQLADDGLSFRDVVRQRRLAIVAAWRQRSPKPSLKQLAERTAFSEGSAVSRFLARMG